MRKTFLTFLSLFPFLAHALSFETGGIAYNTHDESTVYVTSRQSGVYSGAIDIPSQVKYLGNTYAVTGIELLTFEGSDLTSLNIPNSIIDIGELRGISSITQITVATDNPVYDSRNNCNAIIETATNILIKGTNGTIIPKSIVEIGGLAFEYCDLTQIEIPQSIERIGNVSFYGCSMPERIEFSDNLKSIGYGAFYFDNIRELQIPASVTEIGSCAFSGCPIESLVVDPANQYYYSVDNCLIERASMTLLAGGITNAKIPKGIVTIPSQTYFNVSGLTKLIIPQSMTGLGYEALTSCEDVVELYSHNTTPPACYSPLANDGLDSFHQIHRDQCILYVPYGCRDAYAAAEGWSGFKEIVEIQYDFCVDGLYYLITDAEAKTVSVATWPGTYDVPDEQKYRGNITIPSQVSIDGVRYDVTGINNLSWNNITSISIPKSVVSVAAGFLSENPNLTKITVEEGNPVYDSRDNCNAIIETATNTLVAGCQATQIPNTVKIIGTYAFGYCSFPNGTIEIPYGVETIEWNAFYASDIQRITLPNSIKTLDGFWVSSLREINIPASVTFIGRGSFGHCQFENLVVDPSNQYYYSVGNCLIEKATMTLLASGTEKKIPEGVKIIPAELFFNVEGVTELDIPRSVTTLMYGALNASVETLRSIYMHNPVPPVAYSEKNAHVDTFGWGFNGNRGECTLYVPFGSRDAYAEAEGWDGFKDIVEFDPYGLTDISSIDNTIYLEPISTREGRDIEVSLYMKNTETICGFEFNLELPEGVTVPKDDEGYYLIELSTDRTSSRNHNIFESVLKEDGSIYVLCNSTSSKTFSSNEGEVATITLHIADDMEAGDYTVALKNIVLAKSDASTIKVAEVVSLLTVESYTPGDANGDNEINGGDITAISNYLLGYPNSAFDAKGADFNEDNEINGADITAVSNYMLYGNIKGPGNE